MRRSRGNLFGAMATLFWAVLFLALIDIALNCLFRYPTDPRCLKASFLQSYFEYGRSSRGKIERMLRPTDEATAPIALLGWIEPGASSDHAPLPAGKDLLVATYGMSYVHDLATTMQREDPRIALRPVMGPGAPINHSYAVFQKDRGRHNARVAIIGVMAANIAMVRTMSAMTWNVDAAYPYTYPRYVLNGEHLEAVWPTIASLDRMRSAIFNDPSLWEEHCKQLHHYDPFYSEVLVRGWLADRSSLLRLARRGYAQSLGSAGAEGTYGRNGFDPNCESIQIVRAILRDFARDCREDHVLPLVFIVNNYGYSDHLCLALKDMLDRHSIPFISSHSLISPAEPRNYVGDGHFTTAGNRLLAQAALRRINRELGRAGTAPCTAPLH